METMRLKRVNYTDQSTIGELYLPDGAFACFTLEDAIRDYKLKRRTAIPSGRYEVVIAWSNRFQRPMPRLLDVPYYQGILIHSGNRPEHTEGCLLVGRKMGENEIFESIPAFEDLFPKIKKLTEKGKLYIQIEGGFPREAWKMAPSEGNTVNA